MLSRFSVWSIDFYVGIDNKMLHMRKVCIVPYRTYSTPSIYFAFVPSLIKPSLSLPSYVLSVTFSKRTKNAKKKVLLQCVVTKHSAVAAPATPPRCKRHAVLSPLLPLFDRRK